MTAACTEGDSSNRNVNWERSGDRLLALFSATRG